MYIQKIIEIKNNNIKELYVRESINKISYNTYFNLLSYPHIIKYLNTNTCNISFNYKGKVILEIRCKDKKGDYLLYKEELCNKNITNYVSQNIDLSKLSKDGFIYPCFVNFDKDFEVSNMQYQIPSKEREISIIIIITTYKREEYIKRNLELLKQCKSFIKNVIVINNSRTLNDIKSDDYIKIIPNDNTGGSGGFKRGMIEAKKIGCSHIYLMDDDISFDIEIIKRAYNFISNISEDHKDDWLGFSMLVENDPTTQYEMGSTWNGIKMFINNKNLNLSNEKSLLLNIKNKDKYNYSAWWSLILPTSSIDKYGYPLSLFIKFDDIEYSLRRKEDEIILINGLGIWHQNFTNKLNSFSEYFLMRNALIVNSLKIKHGKFKSIIRYIGKYIKHLFRFRLKDCLMINKGVVDYLKGPDFIINYDYDSYNKYLNEEIIKYRNTIINFIKLICVFPVVVFRLLISYNKTKVKYNKEYNNLIKP